MNDQPREVKATHLARKALVYVRQSTESQVELNTGSTDYQRGQARYPRTWGWRADDIQIIEDDLGLSGGAAAHRAGYQRMVAMVEADEAGALFMADLTRGGRDALEWFRLLELCRRHDVLIVIDGKVYDVNGSSELLMARLMAMMAEHDNLMRRETLERGRIAKIEKGYAVTAPPRGYVRMPDGSWVKDPDPNIVAGVEAVFRIFLRERSLGKTVRALLREGIKVYRRRRSGQIEATIPQLATVYSILTNPSYPGDYTYGRRKSDPRRGRDAKGRVRVRLANPDEIRIIRDHHEAYITRAESEHIQTILRVNGWSNFQRNLGPGSGLLQGCIRCAMHRHHAMVTVYKDPRRDGQRSHAYYCIGNYHHGGPQCGRIRGPAVDRAVVDAVLERLAVPRLDALRRVAARAGADDRSELHRRKLELNRLRQEALLLENRFVMLDPSSTEIAKTLELRLETAKRQIRQLERDLATEKSSITTFDDDAFAELIELCRNLRALWNAPTTENQDRKQIIRLMIKDVVLEHRDAECLRLRVRWADGAADTVLEIKLAGYLNRLMVDMEANGDDCATIAEKLNDLGILTTTAGSPPPSCTNCDGSPAKTRGQTSNREGGAAPGNETLSGPASTRAHYGFPRPACRPPGSWRRRSWGSRDSSRAPHRPSGRCGGPWPSQSQIHSPQPAGGTRILPPRTVTTAQACSSPPWRASGAENALRPLCLGRKNWLFISLSARRQPRAARWCCSPWSRLARHTRSTRSPTCVTSSSG